MAREIELKFDLGPGDADRLLGHPLFAPGDPGETAPRNLTAIYFDTSGQALRGAGLSLRIRDEGHGRVQTVKSAGGADGMLARGEWEWPVDADTPDLQKAANSPIGAVLNGRAAELRPVFETRIARLTRTIRHDGVVIEVCLDQGEVATPERRAPLNQLELELKQGEAAALFDLARTLADAAPLRLSFKTKAQAGYSLLDASAGAAVKAEPVRIPKHARVRQAFQSIGRACLAQLTANEPILRQTRSPDSLHQMRIALRRLRAAMAVFGDMAADERIGPVKAELKWLAGELETARNLHVFMEETVRPAAERPPDLEGVVELGEELRRAQAQAYDRALAATGSQRYRDLLLDTSAWLETGPWVSAPPNRRLRERPAKDFAAEALSRRRRSLKRRGERLAQLDPVRRHELRIAAKKMRYAAEFFSGLYGSKAGKRRDSFIGALKELQDCLGKLNDIATGPETAARVLLHGAEPERRSRAIFAAGRIVGARTAYEPELIAAAVRAHADFAKAKPFW